MRRAGIIVFLAVFSFAFNTAAKEGLEYEDWMDYKASYGEVKAVGLSNRTLTVLDKDTEKEGAIVKYYVREDAELEGVESYDEVDIGDEVDLEYYTAKDGTKVVDFMSVEKKEDEEKGKDVLPE